VTYKAYALLVVIKEGTNAHFKPLLVVTNDIEEMKAICKLGYEIANPSCEVMIEATEGEEINEMLAKAKALELRDTLQGGEARLN